jgi:hypothetical protein
MNDTFDMQIHRLLLEPMRFAREAARAGRRVIGYAGGDIPVEIILAAGALPVRLSGRADKPTPLADEIIERAFHPETRSIAEQWIGGELDFLDAILLPRSDDSAQRLYYYVSELQRRTARRGPKPLICESAGINRRSSELHTIAATLRLAHELGARESELSNAAAEVEEAARLVNRIAELRSAEAPLSGSVALNMARALQYCWNREFRAQLQGPLDATRAAGPVRRVMLVGNAPADSRIHDAIEAHGGSVVSELTDAKWFPHELSEASAARSFEEVGSRLHARTTLPQFLARFPEAVVTRARAVRADAVVIWMIDEDNALGWQLPDQLRALERAAIPTLALTREKWNADADTLARIGGFVTSVGRSS